MAKTKQKNYFKKLFLYKNLFSRIFLDIFKLIDLLGFWQFFYSLKIAQVGSRMTCIFLKSNFFKYFKQIRLNSEKLRSSKDPFCL